MLGGGGIDITLRQDDGHAKTWNEQWGNLRTGNYRSVKAEMSGSYFVVVPSVNLEYAILGWVGLRAGASYVGMFSPSWKLDGEDELLGVPKEVNGKGFMINLGLFVGTF